MIIAGIDEAGYGPLLGPLVVSTSAFSVPGSALPTDIAALPCLWTLLKAAVQKKAPLTKGRLIVADSKIVHHMTDGNKHLENGVLTFLAALRGPTLSVRELLPLSLIETLGSPVQELAEHPWYATMEQGLPCWADPGNLAIAGNVLRNVMTHAGVQIVCLRTRVLPEQAFNRMVGVTNNKGAALVSLTLGHAHYLHTQFGGQGLVIGIDKQGGRAHYTPLLLQTFPEAQIKVLTESDKVSSYLVQEPGRQTILHFREKGESHFLPTALASMTCKYLRELCMHGFNAWWNQRVPGISPTAGYYQDGMRWLAEIEPHLERVGVTREQLVRCR